MVKCKYCDEIMYDAPEHATHEPVCFKEHLWVAVNQYVIACGGDPADRGDADPMYGSAVRAIEALMVKHREYWRG